ncbi:helix-turn-helix transcriptional regulator [Luteolibacter sp. GHJ8]|jgi:DNA-binding CsgD family transcriptional regulator|uniref:Helix-turn-helix transcriptional regulator n=1 Tax=Luteolibacter rhizosphaerae TaxID=2989719 RepID=A0ABT3G0L5_9BACT|nr:helix-turn-helix transcriptional regulator [Luteolibacter rhizosphaerae]MCW1913202.1 helix-turn-helix transcriptional regulator [Luteolibacter rhizosphaerae]
MERLHHSDYLRLLDFVAGLQEPVALEDFGAHLVRLTSELLPGATIAFDQIGADGLFYGFDHNVEISPEELARFVSRLQEVYQQNPIYGYITGGGSDRIVDIADLASRRQLHRTDFYHDIFRPYGIEHQVNVLLSRPGWISTLTINRDRPIPPRMKTLLALAVRHIQLAHSNACAMDKISRVVMPTSGELLTAREAEVFRWMVEGKRNGEIAIILGCSPRTVDKHVQNILRKTGTETRTAAVRSGLPAD